MAISSDDPWRGLALPGADEALNARRVDASNPWDFFWARSHDGRYLLVLRHSAEAKPVSRLPRLREIEVQDHTATPEGPSTLTFTLLDSAQKDLFYRLCTDIVEGASGAASEREAVHIAITRTWRWYYLLSGGRDGRLSVEEQQGLIGELLVIEKLLLPALPANDAVSAWRGPLGAPKDFEIGSICIEAKGRRGASAPYVRVNSEHQLDGAGIGALFLFVAELARAPSGTPGAECVTEIARRVRQTITASDPAAARPFDTLLEAAGLKWEDDYKDAVWLIGPDRLYRTGEGFPRLTSALVPAGVSNVTYTLALAECDRFRITEDELLHALENRG